MIPTFGVFNRTIRTRTVGIMHVVRDQRQKAHNQAYPVAFTMVATALTFVKLGSRNSGAPAGSLLSLIGSNASHPWQDACIDRVVSSLPNEMVAHSESGGVTEFTMWTRTNQHSWSWHPSPFRSRGPTHNGTVANRSTERSRLENFREKDRTRNTHVERTCILPELSVSTVARAAASSCARLQNSAYIRAQISHHVLAVVRGIY